MDLTVQMREFSSVALLPDDLRAKQSVYEKVHQGRDAHGTSNEERNEKELQWNTELIYGEIIYQYFVPVLEYADIKDGEVFWDLGCGGGKPVFTAAMAYPGLKAAKGIELLEKLAGLASEI